MSRPIVALMYDFDQTLSPKNMQDYGFMDELDIDSATFWKQCTELTQKNDMDSILSYMFMMLEQGKGKMLLKRENFNKLGKSVKLFPGVKNWFKRINEYCAERGAQCEHYLISSGLREIIEGTEIAGEFKEIYAASFLYDDKGLACWPAMAVNYTSKTQFLFRINKGVPDVTDQKSLNKYVPHEKRRIPFRNMIYFGDGDTDVPCMKLTREYGGRSIAVYRDNDNSATAKRLIEENRVDYAIKADYSKGKAMEKAVFAIIDEIIAGDRLIAMRDKYSLSD